MQGSDAAGKTEGDVGGDQRWPCRLCHVTCELTSTGRPGSVPSRWDSFTQGLESSLSWPAFAYRPSLPERLLLMSEMTVYGTVYLVAHYSVALATVHYFLQLL